MIGTPITNQLPGVAISGVAHEGLSVTAGGRPARLAVIDENGRVIAAGPEVAREAWNVTLKCYRNFLKGQGHLRVHSGPPADSRPTAAAA